VTRRFASLLLLIGATLLIIGNTTHPIDTDPTATSRLDLATAGGWMAIHLTIAVGILAVVAGLTVLSRAVDHPLGAAYARLGATAAIIGGTTLAIVFGALDGYGYATLAAERSAPAVEREAIETVALALDTIDSGMTALGILALFGIAMAAFGAALVTSRIVSRWLGWARASHRGGRHRHRPAVRQPRPHRPGHQRAVPPRRHGSHAVPHRPRHRATTEPARTHHRPGRGHRPTSSSTSRVRRHRNPPGVNGTPNQGGRPRKRTRSRWSRLHTVLVLVSTKP
jgi:hypothetical protein